MVATAEYVAEEGNGWFSQGWVAKALLLLAVRYQQHTCDQLPLLSLLPLPPLPPVPQQSAIEDDSDKYQPVLPGSDSNESGLDNR